MHTILYMYSNEPTCVRELADSLCRDDTDMHILLRFNGFVGTFSVFWSGLLSPDSGLTNPICFVYTVQSALNSSLN